MYIACLPMKMLYIHVLPFPSLKYKFNFIKVESL